MLQQQILLRKLSARDAHHLAALQNLIWQKFAQDFVLTACVDTLMRAFTCRLEVGRTLIVV